MSLTTDNDVNAIKLIAASIEPGIWLLHWPTLAAIYVSPAFERMWGLSADSITAAPDAWLQTIIAEDREQTLARVTALIDEEHFMLEFRIVDGQGEKRWLRSDCSPVVSQDGGVTRIAGVTTDITELKRADELLQRRETMHAAWMASARDFVVYRLRVRDEPPYNASVDFVSPSIERVMGITPDAPVAAWFNGIHVDDRERVERAQVRSATRGVDFDEIMRIRNPRTGELRWIRAISTPDPDPDNNITANNGLIIDLTDRMQAEEENRLHSEALEHSLNGFLIGDSEGRVLYGNRAFLEMWGYQSDDSLHSVSPADFCADPRVAKLILERLNQHGSDRREFTARRGDGSVFEVMMASRMFTSADGRQLILGTAVDVSDRKRADAELRRAAMVFESTAEGVMITDEKGDIVAVNHAFCAISGYAEREVLGRNPSLLSSGRHSRAFFAQMWAALNDSGHWRGEVWNQRRDGEILPVWLTVNRVDDPVTRKPVSYVGLMADISAVKRSEAQLQHMAHHDALTRLPNRLLLDARLQHALQRARREGSRIAVMFLDVDRFKNVNDSLGHPAGDELLCEVAARLVSSLREEDTIARIGGDEFVVVLEGVHDRQYAALAAEKLMRALSGTIDLETGSAALSVSIGVVLYPDHGEDPTTLLKHADAAMYRAKEHGRNQYQFYSDEMTAGANDRLSLEVDMRRALERGDEFTVHYQPLVALASGRMYGVEALMRWQHPSRGLISPDEFIPIAEDCGLIEPLGKWVLQAACEQLSTWANSGLPDLRMSVNVSARQIVRAQLVETVRAVLEQTGLSPALLSLEMTETVLMSDPVSAGVTLGELAALGVGLSVDDFGTGYSSLSYLKRFPVNTLKIDRSFVRDAPHDASDAAICRAVIALAGSLGLQVIAEGVESEAQREFLRAEQCANAQGYLFARPLPADEVGALLRRNYLESVLPAEDGADNKISLFRKPGD